MQRSEIVDPGIAAVEAEGSYLERMLNQTQIWPEIQVPGWEERVRIRPLGRGVEQECHIDAARWVKAKGLDPDTGNGKELYGERAAALILYRALVTFDSDPAKPSAAKPLSESFDKFINHPSISDIFISFAWDEYERVKTQCSPYIEDLPVKARAEIVAELKKNPNGTSLSHLPRGWLESCLRSMAEQLVTSTGSTSSTTSSSSE